MINWTNALSQNLKSKIGHGIGIFSVVFVLVIQIGGSLIFFAVKDSLGAILTILNAFGDLKEVNCSCD